MRYQPHIETLRSWVVAGIVGCFFATGLGSAAEPFVPGTGRFLRNCCDDFENPNWGYTYNLPKSSYEQDERQRGPGGVSRNRLWHEGAMRGTPDVVKRVATPPNGLLGSTGSLMMATKMSGVPRRTSNKQQQDDLLMKVDHVLGGSIPISYQPSCTVRVYLPPFKKWENRTGASFGMRADCVGKKEGEPSEHYWPGMFFLFRSETSQKIESDHAKLTVRADRRGRDVRSHEIHEPGWWTLGMSFTHDGQVHYYASAGVEDLTEDDYLMSSFPYGYKTVMFDSFFFNVANWENGRNWSTRWVIDDPQVFVNPVGGQSIAKLYRRKSQNGRAKQSSVAQRKSSSGRRAGAKKSSRR